jgi:hypothetical protein
MSLKGSPIRDAHHVIWYFYPIGSRSAAATKASGWRRRSLARMRRKATEPAECTRWRRYRAPPGGAGDRLYPDEPERDKTLVPDSVHGWDRLSASASSALPLGRPCRSVTFGNPFIGRQLGYMGRLDVRLLEERRFDPLWTGRGRAWRPVVAGPAASLAGLRRRPRVARGCGVRRRARVGARPARADGSAGASPPRLDNVTHQLDAERLTHARYGSLPPRKR